MLGCPSTATVTATLPCVVSGVRSVTNPMFLFSFYYACRVRVNVAQLFPVFFPIDSFPFAPWNYGIMGARMWGVVESIQ